MLNSYLLSLFALPDKIRYDSIVAAFTRPTTDDLARPYTGNQAYKTRPTGAVKPERPPVPQIRPAKTADRPSRPSNV